MLNPKKIEIPSKETYKLDGVRAVAEKLGHPQLGRRTILVAGTNGKGSTCAYLTALFCQAGLKVGTYSSPHVVSRTERFRINGKPIAESLLKKYERLYASDLRSLTYFERMTILGFLIFRDQKIDLQVLEVGIGGRLDATNISEPDFSAITRIDYDHCEVLGNTLTEIAREKAGIMRRGRVCVVSSQVLEAKRSLTQVAKAIGAQLEFADLQELSSPQMKILRFIENEQGQHQRKNAQVALSLFIKAKGVWSDLKPLSAAQLRKSFQRDVLWPARLQVLSKAPLFLVDGAHNENSLDAFVGYMRRHQKGLKNIQCVFGVMKDKNANAMIRKLLPFASAFHLPSFYPERELEPSKLKKLIETNTKAKDVHTYPDLPSCLKTLKKLRRVERAPVIVVGSLYLAGAVLGALKRGRL